MIALLRFMFLCGIVLASACSGDRSRQIAMSATDSLHKNIAAGEYELVWEVMDEQPKRSGALSKDKLDSIRNDLGELQQFWSRLRSVELALYFPGQLVVIEGEGQYAKGWAHERFEWMVSGGQVILRSASVGPKYLRPGNPARPSKGETIF